MAAPRSPVAARATTVPASPPPAQEWPLDRTSLLWVGLALTAVYFLAGLASPGFYQHDEAGHYLSMRGFWADPSSVLGAWAKPGYKLLYVLPALGGPVAVQLVNAAVAALTVLLTARIASRLGMKAPWLAAALLAVQPIWFQIAWRTYAELPTALLLTLAVWLHLSERRLLAALAMSYVVTLRQELYPVAAMYGLWLLWRREWVAAVSLAIFPLLLNAWGYAATGDPLFVLHQLLDTQSAYREAYTRQGAEHYFVMATSIFGALSVIGFLLYVLFAAKKRVAWHWPLLIPLGVYFTLHVLFNAESLGFGPSTGGNLRYLTVVAPLLSVLAALALEQLALTRLPEDRRAAGYLVGLFVAVAAIFLSYENNMIRLTDTWSFGVLFAALAAAAVALIPMPTRTLVWASLAAGVIAVAFTGTRIKLTAEEKEVQQVVKWVRTERFEQRPLFATHTMFWYFYGKPASAVPGWTPRFNDSTLLAAPPGAIILWDSHYSYRPNVQIKGQVDMKWFQDRPNEFALLRQFVTSDQRFGVLAFERRAPAPATPQPTLAPAP